MEKPASNSHPILDLIRRRWSPVAFSDEPVSREDLLSILEAARWAPSCYNDQPWHFIVATKEQPEEFDRLLHCLADANIAWVQYAPVLMLSVARLHFAHNDKPNRYAWHDIGLAAENMVMQAMSLGIFAHQMAGILPDKAREAYDFPEGYEAVSAIALGYPGDADRLSEALQQRQAAPRSRKPLDSFVFASKWGETFLPSAK